MSNSSYTNSRYEDTQKKIIFSKPTFTPDEEILKRTNSSDDKKNKEWSPLVDYNTDKRPVTTVFDVSAYILNKVGTITTMKLQKLVYYCQAWSLVWDDEPLFSEPIEAWANGPVVKQLFAYHRGMYQLSAVHIGNPDLLNKEQKDTVDAILEYYGTKKSQDLIDLTHMEEPWKNARGNLSILDRGNREITLENMANYYSSL